MKSSVVLSLAVVSLFGFSPSSVNESGAELVRVCHLTGKGGYQKIEVNSNALPAHLGHGDALPGAGGLDQDCNVRPRTYVSRDPEQCLLIRWSCPEGTVVFSDETGCGCEASF